MRNIFFFFGLVLIFSCNTDNATNNSNPDTSAVVDTSDKVENKPSGDLPINGSEIDGCYWKVLKKDTFVLHINQSGDKVSGKLSFNNFEKDKSSGKVHGKIEGDLVKLWYDFQSEGMDNVMEVYFKKENDRLIRGLGPVEVKEDSVFFKKANEVQFAQDQTFTKVDCTTLPLKYRSQ